MPESITAVWASVAEFFSTGLSSALNTITAVPVLCAPIIVWVASKVLGQGKSLLKIGGGRRK